MNAFKSLRRQSGPKPFRLAPLMFEGFASTMSMMAFVALIGPISRLLGLATWQVGLAITTAGIAWMLAARQWGAMSDRRGRRTIMLVGLGGFVVTYAGLCLFLDIALQIALPASIVFFGLIIGRVLAGLFYAAVPATSLALVADHYPPEERTRAIAALGAANGLGMVIGPALAGLVSAEGVGLALVLMTLTPAVSFIVVWRALPREDKPLLTRALPLSPRDQRLRRPLSVAAAAMFCVSAAQIVVGFYALDRLGLDAKAAAFVAGVALAIVGLAFAGAQALVRILDWTPSRFVRWGSLISGLGFFVAAFAASPPLFWLAHLIAAAGMGLVFPAVSALAANAVSPSEQGASAGAVSSAHGVGVVLGPIVGTLVFSIDPRAPYFLVTMVLVAIALSMNEQASARSIGPGSAYRDAAPRAAHID